MAQRSTSAKLLTIVATSLLIAITHVSPSVGDVPSEPLCKRLASYFARRGMNVACDSDGFFRSDVACVEDKCNCVDVASNKLLKRYSFALSANNSPVCQCAVDHFQYRRTRLMGLMFSCAPNGAYSPVQCTGSVCYCVDARGTRVGTQSAHIGQHNSLNC
jgi:hypothetical protein